MLKKLSFITALVAALAFRVLAGEAKGHGKGLEHAPGQHKDPHGQDAKTRFEKICKDLNLTDAQIKKAKPIWEDTEKKFKAAHGDKAKEKAAHEEGEKKFRAALTPDQQKKLDAMKAEHDAKGKGHGDHGKGGDHKK